MNEQAQEQPQIETYEGEVFDDPNRQAVGLAPAWEEGTGGTPGEEPTPKPAEDSEQPLLDDMSKAELLDYARSIGVSPANNDMTKEELRAGIDARQRGS